MLGNLLTLCTNCPVVGMRVASYSQPAGKPQASVCSNHMMQEANSFLLSLDEILALIERLRPQEKRVSSFR